jgi:hypothetical protein
VSLHMLGIPPHTQDMERVRLALQEPPTAPGAHMAVLDSARHLHRIAAAAGMRDDEVVAALLSHQGCTRPGRHEAFFTRTLMLAHEMLAAADDVHVVQQLLVQGCALWFGTSPTQDPVNTL